MKKTTISKICYVILFLSFLGILTSLYLLEDHYSDAKKGSICDFSDTISCSLVNSSKYSELFNVPVSFLGILWLLVLAAITWSYFKSRKKDLLVLHLGWTSFGILFVIYMIWAEFMLKAICPFCTVVHIITVIVFILSLKLYKSQKSMNISKSLKKEKKWIVWIIILFIIPFILFNFSLREKIDYTEDAKCITEKGVNMYGSFRCGVCAKTRAMFGDSFQYINEIECHPQGENPQTELCLEKELAGTPTWILEPEGEELKRYTGFLNVEELKEFAGCTEVVT